MSLEKSGTVEVRENYLAKVTEVLRDRMPPVEIFEMINEVREHLDSMAAARVELGLDEIEAMEASIKTFGPAKKVGGVLLAASHPRWQRMSVLMTPPLALFTTMAFAWGLAFCLFEIIVNGLFSFLFHVEFLPAQNVSQIALSVGLIASPLVWVLRNWRPVFFGLFAATAINEVLVFLLYPELLTAAGGNWLFPVMAVASTVAAFVFGMLLSVAVKAADRRLEVWKLVRRS